MNLALVASHVTPDLVFDLGANIGTWTKEAKQVWPSANFFCIEGNRECAEALYELGCKFVITVLSDSEKEVDFFTLKDCATATGASYYRENTSFFEGDKAVTTTVKTRTLDEVAPPITDETVLCKLDTQGSELDILKGGQRVLSKTSAAIIEVSLTEYNKGAPHCSEVYDYMDQHGFKNNVKLGDVIHPQTQEVIQQDVLFLRQ